MAVYFTDKYKKYYDSLEKATDMTSSAQSVSDEMMGAHTKIKDLSSSIDASSWIELGKAQLTSEFMQIVSTQMGVLNQGATILVEAVTLAIGTLLPKLKILKEKDERLEEIDEQIKALGPEPSAKDSKGNNNPDYATYMSKMNSLVGEKSKLDTELKTLVSDCDTTIQKINSLKPEKIKINVPVGSNDNAQYVKSNQPNNYLLTHNMLVGREGNMLNYGEYSVVDTAFGLVDFFNYIQKNRIYQDGSDATNSCFSAAHFYAKSMLMNEKYSGSLSQQMHSAAGDVYYNRDRRIDTSNKQAALAAIYEELKAGRPVSIDVKRKKPGGRHVITVVGFKSNVKSAADLRSEDLLILDTWDGQIERMDTVNSRQMAAGSEVGQGYKGYNVRRIRDDRFYQIADARARAGLNA